MAQHSNHHPDFVDWPGLLEPTAGYGPMATKRSWPPAQVEPTPRGRILDTAKDLTEGARNSTYGNPYDNLSDIAALWSAYLVRKYGAEFVLTAEDVAWMVIDQKKARTFHGPYHEDNYVDSAAYSGIAGEVRKRQTLKEK